MRPPGRLCAATRHPRAPAGVASTREPTRVSCAERPVSPLPACDAGRVPVRRARAAGLMRAGGGSAMAEVPQVDFALDTYECIVIYPGAAGRALPAETVQRLQAEHAEHMQALQRRGIVLVAGSIDGTTSEPGAADRLRAGPHRQRRRRAQRAGGRPGGAGRPLPDRRADLPLPGRVAGVSAGQDRQLSGRRIGVCRDGDGVRPPAGATVAPQRGPGHPVPLRPP